VRGYGLDGFAQSLLDVNAADTHAMLIEIMQTPLDTTAETPKDYAGFWIRFAAALIDIVVMFTPFCAVALFGIVFVRLVSAARKYDPTVGILTALLVASAFVSLLYFALMESSSWQATIGKKAFGVYVTDIEGRRLTLSRATGRTLAKYLSTLTVGAGYVLCAFTSKKQALHDVIAKCLVMRRLQ
jgi:uncharacterized RDD family membrane protein YckC